MSLFLLTLAACDDGPVQSTQIEDGLPSVTQYQGSVLMVLDDESLFCDGSLQVTRSGDTLQGGGDCGGDAIDLDAEIDDLGEITGTLWIPERSSSAAMLTGTLDEDELVLIWSLEIPLPDDPIEDDDIYQLVAHGEAWLTAL